MPSTEQLVRAVQAGETSAYAELVRLYERTAILTAHAVLHDFHAAQDAAQEAFVIAYAKIGQLREASAFGPWLLRIVRREASLAGRRPPSRPIDHDAMAPNSWPSRDWIERYEKVVAQLAQLPEHERVVVVLRYVDGRSVREVAEATGRPVGTVTKQLTRAVERLRTWLTEVPS